MAEPIAKPSQDPGNDGTMAGMLRSVFDKFVQQLDDMLPATVVSYDRLSNRACVQPMIAMVTTEKTRVTRAKLASVPVLNIGGGGYLLSFNLKPGDHGWIKASDRDISLYLQNLSEEQPNTKRKHSFEDGLFIPDSMKFQIDPENMEHAVLQTLDGKTRIAVWPDKIKITAVGGLEVDGPLKVTGRTMLVGGADIQNKPYEDHWHGNVSHGDSNTNPPWT
ncbi:TPA: Gp138 family membrane-puncturing spike protein [Escherichia coli]